jgi:glucokinase
VRAQVKQLSDHREQLPMFAGMQFEKPSVLSEKLRDRITTEDVGRAARDGDKLALELVEEVGHYVGLGLVNVVALFDPELIVIGGGVAGFGRPLLAAVRQTVLSRGQIFTGRTLEFAFAKLGNDAGIVGASRIAGNLGALRA